MAVFVSRNEFSDRLLGSAHGSRPECIRKPYSPWLVSCRSPPAHQNGTPDLCPDIAKMINLLLRGLNFGVNTVFTL